jgi:hypothetical protein
VSGRTKTYVDPASLRITFAPYEEPFTVGWYLKPVSYEGVLTVAWDSPEGPFWQARLVRHELAPGEIEELRPLLAEDLGEAYDAWREQA